MTPFGATPPNFADCLTIGEAAEFLGVSAGTLRNWDRSGKLKSRRHPQNGYRIYLLEDLQAVLRSAELATLSSDDFAPQFDWSTVGESDHIVQFYENDQFLVETIAAFVASALRRRDASIVICTREHSRALEQTLSAQGFEMDKARKSGQFLMLDAEATLNNLNRGESPDPARFEEIFGEQIAKLRDSKHRIHVFGEMVALLWKMGLRDSAVELEQLWNDLAKRQAFVLLCGYPLAEFNSQSHRDTFQEICACHSSVIPAESYSAADTVDKRLRAVASMQQKVQALETEIELRKQKEKTLIERQRELSDSLKDAKEGRESKGEKPSDDK